MSGCVGERACPSIIRNTAFVDSVCLRIFLLLCLIDFPLVINQFFAIPPLLLHMKYDLKVIFYLLMHLCCESGLAHLQCQVRCIVCSIGIGDHALHSNLCGRFSASEQFSNIILQAMCIGYNKLKQSLSNVLFAPSNHDRVNHKVHSLGLFKQETGGQMSKTSQVCSECFASLHQTFITKLEKSCSFTLT